MPKIPSLTQITTAQSWDQSMGIFLAIVIAAVICLHLVLQMSFSGIMGSRRINVEWMIANFIVGLILSLFTLAITGSWLAGCATAVVCFYLFRYLRQRSGG